MRRNLTTEDKGKRVEYKPHTPSNDTESGSDEFSDMVEHGHLDKAVGRVVNNAKKIPAPIGRNEATRITDALVGDIERQAKEKQAQDKETG